MMLGREFFNLIAALYLQINVAVLLMKKIMFSAQKDPVATRLQCHAIIYEAQLAAEKHFTHRVINYNFHVAQHFSFFNNLSNTIVIYATISTNSSVSF